MIARTGSRDKRSASGGPHFHAGPLGKTAPGLPALAPAQRRRHAIAEDQSPPTVPGNGAEHTPAHAVGQRRLQVVGHYPGALDEPFRTPLLYRPRDAPAKAVLAVERGTHVQEARQDALDEEDLRRRITAVPLWRLRCADRLVVDHELAGRGRKGRQGTHAGDSGPSIT